MTAVAHEPSSIADLGPRTTTHVLRRGSTPRNRSFVESDTQFLERVVAGHTWQDGDQIELWADAQHLVTASLTIQAATRQPSKHWPAPALRNAALHLLVVGFGSLLVELRDGELCPVEFRAAARCGADESSVGFFIRLANEIIAPVKLRYPTAKLQTNTHFDVLGRSTTRVTLVI